MTRPHFSGIESVTPHRFRDATLLERALTHSSCDLPEGDNQRLEFLGDAVLDLVIAEALFKQFPDADEGDLDRCRASIVNGKSLARTAAGTELAQLLRVSDAHRQHHPDPSRSMLEDALEAIIGAVYLDGGIEAARETIVHLFGGQLDAIEIGHDQKNPKGRLQEWSQKNRNGEVPLYEPIAADGPDHERHYSAAVYLGGEELGRGSGSSKKAAEAEAARAALRQLE